jgi:hypothetical protein
MKRRFPLAIGFVLIVFSTAFAQQAAPTPSPAPKPAMSRAQSQKIIIATEKKLWEAWKQQDSKPFKAYLSSDSLMVSDAGVSNKVASLQEMSSMKCDVKSYELSDVKVTFFDSKTQTTNWPKKRPAEATSYWGLFMEISSARS